MAYFKQLDKGWRAQVQKHGTRTSKMFPSKREAIKWAMAIEAELDAQKGSSGMTWAQACEKYLPTVDQGKSAGAREWEERRLNECRDYFGEHTPLVQITTARLGEWRDRRMTEVSASTVIRQFSVIRNLFRSAHEEWKVLAENPCRGVKLPEHGPPRHQVWTWQLIKRVLRAEGRNEREQEVTRAFRIALHTGMRLNEILRANVVGRVAVLQRDKGSGKASAPVKVPLARKGAALFAQYPAFTLQPDIASATFSDMTDELLIDGLTFHDSRASALTWLSRRVDVMTLARISRHKNLKVLMESYYRETAEDIAERLQKKAPGGKARGL